MVLPDRIELYVHEKNVNKISALFGGPSLFCGAFCGYLFVENGVNQLPEKISPSAVQGVR
jgi:hypothetical protein